MHEELVAWGALAALARMDSDILAANRGDEEAKVGVACAILELERRRQTWTGQAAGQAAVYANRRRLQTKTGKALM